MLKQRAISATLWSGADILLRQGLQFSVSIALARLVSPEEFGTIALLYLFMGIAGAFVDSGLSAALIQRQDVTHADESTVFWFNLGVGILVSLCLWASGPVIARVFAHPVLALLTSAMALNVFLTALGSIQGTLLAKNLDFRSQMKVTAVSTIVSGVVAVTMAVQGYGVWALAAQTLVATAATTACLWVVSPWRPAFLFNPASARRLLGFGAYMLGAGLLETAYSRLYALLIGKFYGVRELGFYNRADTTKQLPAGVLAAILSRVALPIFSAAAHDAAQLRRGTALALRGIMLINVPMMLGVGALAEPLVLTLFGARWLPAVPALQVLSLGALFWPLHVINLNVLMAQGHSHLFFRLEVVKKILGVVLLLIGCSFGTMGIAWSQVFFGALAFGINAYYTKKHLNYGVVAQVRDFFPVLAISLPMAATISWLSFQIEYSPIFKLLGLSTLGLSMFVVFGMLFRIGALRDAIALVRTRNPVRQ